MTDHLNSALAAGYERLGAWSELLDQINVFPVADGDTGRNLRLSLAPLYRNNGGPTALIERLLHSATGNSGNIAAAFFSGFLADDPFQDFPRAVRLGHQRAIQVLMDPLPGTMLSLFEALSGFFDEHLGAEPTDLRIRDHLADAVRHTPDQLAILKASGVVDAGALGLYIFFEGFFTSLADGKGNLNPVTETFRGQLQVTAVLESDNPEGFCIDTVLTPNPVWR
jgi:dihydroxyacetone kinase-like predicted kinase